MWVKIPVSSNNMVLQSCPGLHHRPILQTSEKHLCLVQMPAKITPLSLFVIFIENENKYLKIIILSNIENRISIAVSLQIICYPFFYCAFLCSRKNISLVQAKIFMHYLYMTTNVEVN